jgi:hypothetical protein
MKQLCVTPAMGKRLIGMGMASHPEITRVLEKGTLVIIAGTTNGYVAEEILTSLGQAEGFYREGFRRGMHVPPGFGVPEAPFPGDMVIRDGACQKGKTIAEVAGQLQEGDIVLKGANAFDPRGQAAVQVGSTDGGTILAALHAIIGRRVQLIIPVGLEKRVFADVNVLASRVNAPGTEGPRLLPMPGRIFTELDAIDLLTGAHAQLIAAGGIYGAEGAAWLGISGTDDAVAAALNLIESLADEPPCRA